MVERRGAWRGIALLFLLVLAAGAGWFARGARSSADTGPADAGAAQAERLWTCGMHPQVLQKTPGECPICHMQLTPYAPGAPRAQDAAAGTPVERRVRYWIDAAMEPPFVSKDPGNSPAGRELVPVHAEEFSAGDALVIDPRVQQNMGLRTAAVERGTLVRTLRLPGVLVEPEGNKHDVALRVSGFIETLHADTVGRHVPKGAPMFELYSPELTVAVEELIAARRAAESAKERGSAASLLALVKRKLGYMGVEDAEIERLALLERAPRTVTFASPFEGHVIEKDVVAGARVEAGERVLRLSDRSTLWLRTSLTAAELPQMKVGARVRAIVDAAPGREFTGTIDFVHPHFDAETRTAEARALLRNEDEVLREGMFARVEVAVEAARDAVLVPREAVIDSGTRQIAFVVLPDGAFEPVRVTLGASGDGGLVQVLAGLAPGERVVTSGQFLLDGESRIREGVKKFLAASGAERAEDRLARLEAPEAEPALVDAVLGPYLALAELLGAATPPERPFEALALTVAAQKLVEGASGPTRKAAEALRDQAFLLVPETAPAQRARFRAVSDAVIAIVRRAPPSKTFGERVFVIECPMAPGGPARWLSRDEVVRNPYFETSMKACGAVVGSIECARGR